MLGKRLAPYDDRDALRRAILADAPHFDTHNEAPVHPGADPAIWGSIGAAGAIDTKAPLESPIRDFYLTNPIRTRASGDHGRMQPHLRQRRR